MTDAERNLLMQIGISQKACLEVIEGTVPSDRFGSIGTVKTALVNAIGALNKEIEERQEEEQKRRFKGGL